MKKKLFKIIIIALCLFSIHRLNAQTSTQGTDFWLTFGYLPGRPYADISLQIRIVNCNAATSGTITFTELGSSTTFSIAANSVYNLNTGSLSAAHKQAVYNNFTATTITNRSMHITTTAPVAVYAMNQAYNVADATGILPTPVLGTNYYQISYKSYNTYRDNYAVIATENATQVFENGAPTATLCAGQVYYRTSAANTDMTGAHITTNKPVAFFAACESTQIPADRSGADNLFEQLFPVYTWGTRFLVPISHMKYDLVRIMVSQNGTNITQTGGTIRSVTGGQTTLTGLNAGQWVELSVQQANNGCYIEADKPVGVCTYLAARGWISSSNTESDPAQAWLPSLDQRLKSMTITPFIPAGTTELDKYYAMVITSRAAKNNTTLSKNGAATTTLSGGTWYDHSSSYSFYLLKLSTISSDTYKFDNPDGLLLMGYATGYAESIYYCANAAITGSETITTTSSPAAATITSVNNVCEGTNVSYSVSNVENMTAPLSYQWLVNGSPIGGATNATFNYTPVDGEVISCRVTSNETTCPDSVVSNEITMIVTSKRNPSITITAVPD